MSEQEKPTHTLPGGKQDTSRDAEDGVVNDSLGKVDTADTTGTGEENQPCENRDTPTHRKQTGHESSPRRS